MEEANQPTQNPVTEGKSFLALFAYEIPLNKKSFWLGIAAAIVIAIGAYILGTKQSQPVVQDYIQTTPSPSPIPTIDETANWKKYTSTKFGFSVRYPSDWKIEVDNPIKPDIVIYSSDNSSNLVIAPISEARYTTDRNRSKKLADSPTVLFSGRSARDYKEEFENEFDRVFVRDIQIEDLSGLSWTEPNEISYWVDISQPDLLKVFDQILSTFKFTDENLDGKVWVDIDQIGAAINIYYFDNKKLPQNLEVLTTYPGLNNFKLNNNPYTGKPYQFTTKSDGSGFILSGTVRDGTEYKKEFPIK